jgi:hypothetical protein
MRFIAVVFLIILFLAPPTSAIERFELEGEISLIVTNLRPTYYILTLVNKNDFNVSLVENMQVNFTRAIDPALVSAVDNYNTSVVPDKIELRSITFSYNNTIPALGYGKIFIYLDKPGPTPVPPTRVASTTTTITTSITTTSTTSPTTLGAPIASLSGTTTTTVPVKPPSTTSPETLAPSESLPASGSEAGKLGLPASAFLVLILPVLVVIFVVLNHFLPSNKADEQEK